MMQLKMNILVERNNIYTVMIIDTAPYYILK